MSQTQIGAQMYTLRQHLQTPQEIAHTCRRVRQLGYEAIQVSSFGPIETAELAKILNSEGLICASTHVSLDLLKDVNQCVEYHEALGCRLPAIGGYRVQEHTRANYEAFAADFSHTAGVLAEKGLRIGYHNHSRELARTEDGPRILDILIENTDHSVWFEIDTYWIAFAGGDPAAWIEKVADRAPCIHVKDMLVTTDQQPQMCEVGQGNLNWPRIIESSRRAQVQWYLVERDHGDLDPFESLRISLEGLRGMGLG